jgi:hypothetical protein
MRHQRTRPTARPAATHAAATTAAHSRYQGLSRLLLFLWLVMTVLRVLALVRLRRLLLLLALLPQETKCRRCEVQIRAKRRHRPALRLRRLRPRVMRRAVYRGTQSGRER